MKALGLGRPGLAAVMSVFIAAAVMVFASEDDERKEEHEGVG